MRKNKIFKYLLSSCLTAAILISSAIPVFASSTGSSSDDLSAGSDIVQNASTQYAEFGEGNADTDVYLTVDTNNVVVGVPTSIILSGIPDENGSYSAEYSITASGDIPGNTKLSVAPKNNTVSLSQEGKDNIDADIVQEKTVFNCDDLKNGSSAKGKVTATALSAGSWKANSKFVIKMGENIYEEIPTGYSMLYKYDVSATVNDDVAAYYCVPDENITTTVSSGIKSRLKTTVAKSAPTVIENDGTYYELSDDDTIVISGEGNMKSDLYSSLMNYNKVHSTVEDYFAEKYPKGTEIDQYLWTWRSSSNDILSVDKIVEPSTNALKVYVDGKCFYVDHSLNTIITEEIQNYTDSIKNSYVLAIPKNVIVRAGVTNVSSRAFYKCSTLKSIVLPDTVTSIDNYAFGDCTNFDNINIPYNVKTIGAGAFYNTAISTINLPNTLATIEENTFSNCSNLTSIVIPENVTKIKSGAFTNSGLKELTIPCSAACLCGDSWTISKRPFQAVNLEKLTLTKGTGIIPNYSSSTADYRCFNSTPWFTCQNTITDFVIEDGITSVGNYAFYKCSILNDVTSLKNVTSVGQNAFTNTAYYNNKENWNDGILYLNNDCIIATE